MVENYFLALKLGKQALIVGSVFGPRTGGMISMKFLIYLFIFCLAVVIGAFLFIGFSDVPLPQTEIVKEIKPSA
jgi:hypothetical protein